MDSFRAEYVDFYDVWVTFKVGKKLSNAIDEFGYYLEQNILKLTDDISNFTYEHGDYQKITIVEKKRRDLAVATVRDRVVHRLVYDFLYYKFNATFDPDVWSCRKDKGLHGCLKRTQKLLQKYTNKDAVYVWRSDVQKFFDSVDHRILKQIIKRKVADKTLQFLLDKIIDSYKIDKRTANSEQRTANSEQRTANSEQRTANSEQRTANSEQRTANSEQPSGIPIGNITSQIFANIYLNEFDRFVRHHLKPLAYVRYGDDFVLLAKTRKQAIQMRQAGIKFLEQKLGLSINSRNDIVVNANLGVHFLGHIITTNVIVVDKVTTQSVLKKVNWNNVASYKALYLDDDIKKQLDWILLEKTFDI